MPDTSDEKVDEEDETEDSSELDEVDSNKSLDIGEWFEPRTLQNPLQNLSFLEQKHSWKSDEGLVTDFVNKLLSEDELKLRRLQ